MEEWYSEKIFREQVRFTYCGRVYLWNSSFEPVDAISTAHLSLFLQLNNYYMHRWPIGTYICKKNNAFNAGHFQERIKTIINVLRIQVELLKLSKHYQTQQYYDDD